MKALKITINVIEYPSKSSSPALLGLVELVFIKKEGLLDSFKMPMND